MEKLTLSEVIKEVRVIHMSPGGWEYIAEKEQYFTGPYDYKREPKYRWVFPVKRSWNRDLSWLETKEEKKQYLAGMREANCNLAAWKKGVGMLIKLAKEGPGAMDQMAWAYTGNGPLSPKDKEKQMAIKYFWRLYNNTSNDKIILMGKTKNTPDAVHPVYTNYVDGSCECNLYDINNNYIMMER